MLHGLGEVGGIIEVALAFEKLEGVVQGSLEFVRLAVGDTLGPQLLKITKHKRYHGLPLCHPFRGHFDPDTECAVVAIQVRMYRHPEIAGPAALLEGRGRCARHFGTDDIGEVLVGLVAELVAVIADKEIQAQLAQVFLGLVVDKSAANAGEIQARVHSGTLMSLFSMALK